MVKDDDPPAADSVSEYYELNPAHTDPKRLRKERENGQKLKKTRWWLDQLNRGICHYCEKKFGAGELTMDHVVPLARGGTTAKGNVVPACRNCNQRKRLHTPVDIILRGKPNN